MPQVPSTSQAAFSGPPPGSSQNCTGPLQDQSLGGVSQNNCPYSTLMVITFLALLPGLDPPQLCITNDKGLDWREDSGADDYHESFSFQHEARNSKHLENDI